MENYLNKPVSFLLIIRDAACKSLKDICVQKVQRGCPPVGLALNQLHDRTHMRGNFCRTEHC